MEQVLERRAKASNDDGPRVMHRKGSLKGRIEDPKNLQERLASRRLDLDMSQEGVAEQVSFWNARKQERKTLSRSAYCMYESGDVVPDLDKIKTLANILRCTPEWLAFGIGEVTTTRNMVDEVEYHAKSGDFITRKTWTLDPEWLETRFDAAAGDLALVTVNDFSASLKPGDVAVVRRGIEPTSAHGEYVFAYEDEMKVAPVTRPTSKGPYRIYDADRRHYEEVTASALHFLGKVVGRMGDI